MRPLLVLMLYSLFVATVEAQTEFKGQVVDGSTNEPIPFVNIGVVDAGIGTVSDEDGLFHLDLNRRGLSEKSSVLFSALGYKNINISIDKLELTPNTYPKIILQPSITQLDEVVVYNDAKKFVKDFIGYRNYGEKSFGYWKDQIALGGELATKIVCKSGLRRLERFQFEVYSNPSDSLLLRVNLYQDDGASGGPKTNLNKSGRNILVTVKKSDKLVWVDLKPYEIYVENDFLISLELLEIYGGIPLNLVLKASFNNYGSYRRYASQDKWDFISGTNMAFFLETQLLVSEKLAERYQRKLDKKKSKIPTISGFAIYKGKMVPEVTVTNQNSGETLLTDASGRYRIKANTSDVLSFKKEGFEQLNVIVSDKPTLNARLKEAR